MKPPKVDDLGGVYRFTWEEGIEITLARIREGKGSISTEATVKTSLEGYGPYLMQGNLSLTSIGARQTARKELEKACDTVDWAVVLGQLCTIALIYIREGTPTEELDTEMEYPPVEFLIHPILPANETTIIFGPRESGKSFLALALGICARISWQDNKLGLIPPPDPTPVLYLDWETHAGGIGGRLKALSNGLKVGYTEISYKECLRPVEDMAESLQMEVAEKGIGLIILDSLGKACSGPLAEDDTALRFWQALRRVKTTKLILAHTSKNAETGKRSVYGNAYFENDPRYIWEACKEQEEEEDTITMALYHHKSNITKKFKPIGYQFLFNGEDNVSIKQVSLNNTGLLRGRNVKADIINHLKGEGLCTCREIADATGHGVDSCRTTLNRGRNKYFLLQDGKWGYLTQEFQREE